MWSTLALLVLGSGPAHAITPVATESYLNKVERHYQVRLWAELGTVLPVSHKIQFDSDGTYFDYVKEGGQDNLFPYARLQVDLDLGDRTTIVLLYQPLDISTSVRLDRELVVDDGVFAAGTPLDLRYGFDFYRASWLHDLDKSDGKELAVGLSLQIRNATIDFRSADGELQRSNRNIGPVPVLKTRMRRPLGEGAWVGFEADGFYAPVSYLNGDNNEVVGAILDTSVKAGVKLNRGVDGYVNLRYIGGGAEGISDNSSGPGDGYTRNWIHTVALSVGAGVR